MPTSFFVDVPRYMKFSAREYRFSAALTAPNDHTVERGKTREFKEMEIEAAERGGETKMLSM